MSKVVLLVGLPGSGKSTYANKLVTSSTMMKHISSEAIREELYGDASIQGNPNKIFEKMHKRAKDYLLAGFDVVYDATNVTRKNRQSVISRLKPYCKDGLEAHIIWTPYTECISNDMNSSRHVGENIIRKFLYKWESPNYDEGFTLIDIIYNVKEQWNTSEYISKLLNDMNIDHDNPHHTLNIINHCYEAENYIRTKWSKSSILQEAGMYHDIGKPFTKCYKKDSNNELAHIAHYYHHDNVGGYLVYGCYSNTSECKQKSIMTSWLVCNHMQPYFNSTYYKNLNSMYKEWLNMLHEADVAAH